LTKGGWNKSRGVVAGILGRATGFVTVATGIVESILFGEKIARSRLVRCDESAVLSLELSEMGFGGVDEVGESS
jgi:hypothetical protein